MHTIDFTPFYRSTVGFDRLFDVLDNYGTVEGGNSTYPPYNIERLDENAYRITMAVAGFAEADIEIEKNEQDLRIVGQKTDAVESEFLHQGIANRSFERKFQLADYVEVLGAKLENGLLHIDLKRELPEKMKPRKIAVESVQSAAKAPEHDVIDA